jgi:hypothetical protein
MLYSRHTAAARASVLKERNKRLASLQRRIARANAKLTEQHHRTPPAIPAAPAVPSSSADEMVDHEDLSDGIELPPSPAVSTMDEVRKISGQGPRRRIMHTSAREAARTSAGWRRPKPLSECPFTRDQPCCRKSTKCYEYFGGEVAGWRDSMLMDSTKDKATVAASLKAHREASAGRIPGTAKGHCTKFQQWWVGDVNKRDLWPSSHTAGNRTRNAHKRKARHTPGLFSQKDVSVISWFQVLVPILECMPDTDEYHGGRRRCGG